MSAPLRRAAALALVLLALLGGCSLPGTSAPTATPPPPTATVPPVATAMPSAPPATPTATATAAATSTATRPVPAATPATPTARLGIPATPPTPATPVVGTLIQDTRQACELTLPGEFVPTATPGTFARPDGKVLVTLQSLPAGPDDTLDDLALPFVGAFIPTVRGYEQTMVIRLADNLRIDFTGDLAGRGDGSLYFKQFGPTVCVVTLFVADGTTVTYESFFESLIVTLRPKGVG
jgi:hypothetical protein